MTILELSEFELANVYLDLALLPKPAWGRVSPDPGRI